MYKISLQFTSYFGKTVFSSSPVSLHDANLIGPYEDNLQTVSYNTSTPIFSLDTCMSTFETFFIFAINWRFELLAIALHYLSAAGVRLTRDRYYCIE